MFSCKERVFAVLQKAEIDIKQKQNIDNGLVFLENKEKKVLFYKIVRNRK